MKQKDAVIVYRKPSELIPNPNNARTHSDAQIAEIAGSIKEYGFTQPVLTDGTDGILAGHGRVLASLLLKLERVPCVELGHLSPNQRRAYILADNKIALNAGWDEDLLLLELTELQEIDDGLLDITGFDSDELKELLDARDADLNGEDVYSRKIEAPIYEPRGDKPEPRSLYDGEKASQLIEEIRATELPEDIALFLERAAERHTVFNFERIADFYAHSEPDIQRLMESSALVIIDFDKAIENGFIKITKRMGELSQEGQEQ